MIPRVTFGGGVMHALLAGGYSLWAKPAQQNNKALALLTLVQTTQYPTLAGASSKLSRDRVQLVYDLIPYVFFGVLTTNFLATVILGTLYLGVSRAAWYAFKPQSPPPKDTPPPNTALPPLQPTFPKATAYRVVESKTTPSPPLMSEREEVEAGQKILVNFYLGKCVNLNGVTIDQIWKYNRSELEAHHDFIQWLFPIENRSRFEPRAPLLNKQIKAAFADNPELPKRLVRSFELMLWHYGLKLSGRTVGKAEDFETRKTQMLGHNTWRITRILDCMLELGQIDLAKSFFAILSELYHAKTMGTGFQESYRSDWQPIVGPYLF